MQIVDILTGALTYRHSHSTGEGGFSQTKVDVINRIVRRSGVSLTKSTLLSEKKMNLLVWEPYMAVR